VVLAAATLLRLRGLDWDAHHHLHPDERFISMVEAKLTDPGGLRAYLNPRTSTLNPYNVGFPSFVYGTLPMLLARYAGERAGLAGYDGTYLAGRFLSGLFDLITIWLVYRLTRRLADRKAALLAAALLAGSPLAIQLSHFWTVDTFLTTFATASLLASVRLAQGHRDARTLLLGGVTAGLAISCKVTGLALVAPVGLGLVIGSWPGAGTPLTRGEWIRRAWVCGALGLVILFVTAATVRIALPYAFASANPLRFSLDPRWVEDLRRLDALMSAVAGFPPNFQWAGRTIGFPLWNLVVWGCSPFFGLPALLGAAAALASLRRRAAWPVTPLLLYITLVFAYHGFTTAKYMRYFYPSYPALAVCAALLLRRWLSYATTTQVHVWKRLVVATCIGGTLVSGLTFSAIYGREHTRVWASRWIYGHIQPSRLLVNETWDDSLPLAIAGFEAGRYSGPQLEIVGADNPAKVDAIVDALTKADGIAVTSNRAYGSLTRVPEVFPMTRAYYRALFDGRLGYRLVADVTSYPALGPLTIPDDGAEEAFTVYDHPRVLLFVKESDFSPDRVRGILTGALPLAAPTLTEWSHWPRGWQQTVAAITPPRHADSEVNLEPDSIEPLGSIKAVLAFYAALTLLGAIALPLMSAVFPCLADHGFGFARLAGLLIATYTTRVLLWTGLLSSGPLLPWLGLAVVAALSGLAFRADPAVRETLRLRRRALLASEGIFAVGFLLFVGARALHPEIYWGEKPMDLSILNVLVRSPGLPPPDPWFAGTPLSYYFFGHEMVAFLSQLTQIPTRYTFNLAFGLLGGATLQGAFALAANWGHRTRAGVAAAVFALLIGNLSGLREWLIHGRALDWDYFWATSRVVKDTINEYPLWSLLFADLHAHVIAIPMLLLVLAAALNFVRARAESSVSWRARVFSIAALGSAAGVQALTNAWDVPLLLGLFLIAPMAIVLNGRTTVATVVTAASDALCAAAVGLCVAGTMWSLHRGSPGIGRNIEGGAAGVDILTVFGFFFLLALVWWTSAALTRWKPAQDRSKRRGIAAVLAIVLTIVAVQAIDAFLAMGFLLFLSAMVWLAQDEDERLACGLAAAAFLLVLVPQHLYIGDRMNTFFKLYLEAWLLFAIATGVLVFGRSSRWEALGVGMRPAQLAVLLVFGASTFTGMTATRAAVSRHFARYSGPSLDGLRYLREDRPEEHEAVRWFSAHVPGTPVILEAQGPSYQDFARISMLTGLPTVLGWDYHVKQRGNTASDVQARQDDIRTIYEATDAAAIDQLLRRYRIAYVYDGWLERKVYSAAGLRKFGNTPNIFQLVYENPQARIYRVVAERSDALVER